MNLKDIRLNELIKSPIRCDCGHEHKVDLKSVIIESGAIAKLPDIMKKEGRRKAFLIADKNTYQVAGRKVEKVLNNANLPFTTMRFKEEEIIPDEKAVGSVCMAYDETCDIPIAIGTGTINDIVKFFSYKMKLPYYIIGTAPSMDGFISTAAAMTTNNLKTTYTTHVPRAFIGDLDILSEAPMPMIAAGFADIMGKYTCLNDWKLSKIINDEFYCDFIADLMTSAVNKTMESVDGLVQRDKDSIEKLTYGLLLSGIAMSYIGNSRPASGSEHHMSHFWEMLFQCQGKKPVLHGAKVGIGTIFSIKLYEYFKQEEIDFTKTKSNHNFSYDKWEKEIKRAFPSAWEEIIDLEMKSGKNSTKNWEVRILSIENNLDKIKQVCDSLPPSQKIEKLLYDLEGPIRPDELDISESAVMDAIMYGKEIRNRYTILQLLWDLGLLEKFSEKIINTGEL